MNDRTWKQQVVGGMWVHWIQKDMGPEAWGVLRFFVRAPDGTVINIVHHP